MFWDVIVFGVAGVPANPMRAPTRVAGISNAITTVSRTMSWLSNRLFYYVRCIRAMSNKNPQVARLVVLTLGGMHG